MKSITKQPLKHRKIHALLKKSISSVALLENPQTKTKSHGKNNTQINLSNPLNKYSTKSHPTLQQTKVTHAHLLRNQNFYRDIFAANNLLDSYFKCGFVYHAFNLFDTIPDPNIVSWNLMISGCNKNFFFEDSFRVFAKMHFLGVDVNEFTYGSVLSACGSLGGVVYGGMVYGFVLKNGFFSNGYVRAGMIDLFSKCSRFNDALKVFSDVSCENVVCWNAVVSGAVKNSNYSVALDIFGQMSCHGSLRPNGFTFSGVLTACAALEELELGKVVQGWVLKCGVADDVFVGTAIVDFYGKCGYMDEAVKQFMQMPEHNVVSWTTIISGFVQNGDSASAVRVFDQMRSMGEDINNYTVTSLLAACANPAMFKEAMQIHCWILKLGLYSDPVVQSSLISMYSKIGALNLSEIAFSEADNLHQPGTWANMISAFAQNEVSEKAINLFKRMWEEGMRPDKYSTSCVLSVIDTLSLGRQLHGYALKAGMLFDVSLCSSLFTMYSKCGSLEESHKVFGQLEGKDNVAWASMIAGFAEHGHSDKAIELFREMLLEGSMPDEMTLNAVLTACAALCCLKIGREVHGFALRSGFCEMTVIGCGLVNFYAKCEELNSARLVFEMMPFKDKVSCSSLVSGYAQSGHIEEALQLFHEMLLFDPNIDSFTISSIVGAIAVFNRPSIGTQLHAYALKIGSESEASVGSSLLMMYSKCGSIGGCCKVFHQIKNPDLISWTTMISSYAQHGKGLEALEVYELMKRSGIRPDAVTFVGVLSACSHAGLVEEGYFHLNSMMKDYGIAPGYRHYTCMVDLLGRAGRLKEAERLIRNIPMEPDALIWGTLLAACKVHGDIELGKIAAEKIMELEPSDSGVYVSLSNILADVGQWGDVLKIRDTLGKAGIKKEPGWSTV